MRQVIAKTSQVIALGRQGENDAVQVQFPVMENLISTYGEGSVSLVAQRPKEPFSYLVGVTNDAENVYWDVKKEDLAIAGDGRCQINYVVNGAVVKTKIYKTVITPALGENHEILNPYTSWVNEILQAVSSVSEAAGIIKDATLPFIAIYGTTKYADITRAINDERPVIAIDSSGTVLPYAALSSGKYVFSGMAGNTRHSFEVGTNNSWTHTSAVMMAQSSYDTTSTGNKVDTALNAENLGGSAASTYLNTSDAGDTYAKPGLVYASAVCNTLDALTAQLNTWVSGMSANTVRFFLVNVGLGYEYGPFVQAGYLLMLYKRSAELACAFFARASLTGNVVISMTMTTTGSVTTWSDPASVTFGDNAVGASIVRNIYAGTSDMTAGSSDLTTGRIYLVYEV